VQLRFEASVCAAIPVIKVLREALVASNVHRILGIVNGTTNFMLGSMENGRSYGEALSEAQRLGYAEADPTDDVGGGDAAAKMAILATVAFGGRVALDDVQTNGIEGLDADVFRAARALDMRVKLIGEATLVGARHDVRVGPALVDSHHPLAAVDGAYNAVMLQGDAIREITLEGPGAGGIETASAVVADLVSILGTTGTGFLQNDPVRRELAPLDADEHSSPAYLRIEVDDRPGVLSSVAGVLGRHDVSIARLVQVPADDGAVLHVVTHRAAFGALDRATKELVELDEAQDSVLAVPVISDRGVEGLGWA
jgi:homoserine dehydrogenase